jgi:hypothetical protein
MRDYSIPIPVEGENEMNKDKNSQDIESVFDGDEGGENAWSDLDAEDELDTMMGELIDLLPPLDDVPNAEEAMDSFASKLQQVLGGIAYVDIFVQEAKRQGKDVLPVLLKKARVLRDVFPIVQIPIGNGSVSTISSALRSICRGKDISFLQAELLSMALNAFAQAVRGNNGADKERQDSTIENEFLSLINPIALFPQLDIKLGVLQLDRMTWGIIKKLTEEKRRDNLSSFDPFSQYTVTISYQGSRLLAEPITRVLDENDYIDFESRFNEDRCDIKVMVDKVDTKGCWFRECKLVKHLGSLLVSGDILSWSNLCDKLTKAAKQRTPNPGKRVWGLLSKEIRSLLEKHVKEESLPNKEKREIIIALNKVLDEKGFYQEQDYSDRILPNKIRRLLAHRQSDFSTRDIQRLNRLLLEAAYPKEIAKSSQNLTLRQGLIYEHLILHPERSGSWEDLSKMLQEEYYSKQYDERQDKDYAPPENAITQEIYRIRNGTYEYKKRKKRGIGKGGEGKKKSDGPYILTKKRKSRGSAYEFDLSKRFCLIVRSHSQ